MKKMKVMRYMRVNSKEQIEPTLTKEEQAERYREIAQASGFTLLPPHSDSQKAKFDKAVAEGATPVTLPKKKAWVFMRTSKNTPHEEQVARLNIIRQNAIDEGYEIVGETVVVGNSKQAKTELKHLLEHYLANKKAEIVYMRGLRDMSFKFEEITEMYDMIKSAGLEVKTADGSIQALEGETEHGMKWRDIFTSIIKGQSDEQAEPSEDEQDEGEDEAPTQTMGGGMQ